MFRVSLLTFGFGLTALGVVAARVVVSPSAASSGVAITPAPEPAAAIADPLSAFRAALNAPSPWGHPLMPGRRLDSLVPRPAVSTGEGDGAPGLPSRHHWESLSWRLEAALASGTPDALAALAQEAQAALHALRSIPGQVEFADWLQARLKEIEFAQRTAQIDQTLASGEDHGVPLYPLWLEWLKDQPPPARAAGLVPQLKAIFVSEQLPPALVWIAETESSFDPRALSRAGARGLFQLMPQTAKELGLRVDRRDERLDPARNARTAARYLAKLHDEFACWRLVLAAYNAGPGRVARLLEERGAASYAEIADGLPVETQLYVPKVLATVTIREGLTPAGLALTQSTLAIRD